MKSETWVLNSTLYTQDEKRRVVKGHLRIIDGVITSIQKTKPLRIPKSSRIIDAQGLTLFPGFIQAHIHLCQTLFRNQADDLELMDWLSKRIWIREAAHTEETLYTSALAGIYELLSSGTTTILDMGTIRHTESIFQAVRDSGIRASVGKCLMDHPQQTPPYLRENTAQALAEASALYSQWNGKENDRIRASYAPRFAISCTEELLREVSSLALSQKAVIHTHASENQKEIALVREMYRCENIEFFEKIGMTSSRLVLAHGIWMSAAEKQILLRSGTHIAHCPSSNLKLASGIAAVPELRAMGINVALGTDGAPCNNNLNMFQEIRLAALIHKPDNGPTTLRAMEALDMATRDGAKALNWDDQIGSIEVGKKADLIALNLKDVNNWLSDEDIENPEAIASTVVYSCQPSHLAWTMVDGKCIYQDGVVKTIKKADLLKDLRKAQKTIRRRVGQLSRSSSSSKSSRIS